MLEGQWPQIQVDQQLQMLLMQNDGWVKDMV